MWLQKKVWQKNFFSPLSFLPVFGSGIRDPGSGMGKNQDPGSVINIPDPQHCKLQRLAGRFDNPMSTWFLAPMAGQVTDSGSGSWFTSKSSISRTPIRRLIVGYFSGDGQSPPVGTDQAGHRVQAHLQGNHWGENSTAGQVHIFCSYKCKAVYDYPLPVLGVWS